jgi:hypothetical protein
LDGTEVFTRCYFSHPWVFAIQVRCKQCLLLTIAQYMFFTRDTNFAQL